MGRNSNFVLAASLFLSSLTVTTLVLNESPARAALSDSDSDGRKEVTTCSELFSELASSSASFEIYTDASVNSGFLDCTGVSQAPISGFTGSLHGNGVTVSGINISCSTVNCGIFNQLSPTSTPVSISNLIITGANVTSSSNYAGILAGRATLTGATVEQVSIINGTVSGIDYVASLFGGVTKLTTSDVSSSASVTGSKWVGGLVGEVGSYVDCATSAFRLRTATFTGSVAGKVHVGGLVGRVSYSGSSDSTCGILESSNSGTVTSSATSCYNFGGLVGELYTGRITDSWNSGAVTTTHTCSSVGGLVGGVGGYSTTQTSSHILRSWNTGTVSANGWYVGGIAGYCGATKSTIAQVYNFASVTTSSSQVGGLTGPSHCIATDSFSRGNVAGSSSRGGAFGEYMSGTTSFSRIYSVSNYGFLGGESNTVRSCPDSFWDISLAATSPKSCTGATGKSTTDMKLQSTFTNWDFVNTWAIDPTINDGYPFLRNVGVASLPGGSSWGPPAVTLTTATIASTGNAVVESTETGTAYLVSTGITVTNVASITAAADNAWNQITITAANTPTNLAATGLADGTYKAYAADNAGNLSTASTGTITITTPDTTAPAVTLTTATIASTGNAVVESTETGTAYLVSTGITVTNVASITAAADNAWNQVTITAANTPTNLAATGLADGTYKAYAADNAGNLSTASTGTITITTAAPSASPTTTPATTTPATTTPVTTPAPSLELSVAPPIGVATSLRSDGTVVESDVTRSLSDEGVTTIRIRNSDGTELTVVHSSTVILTPFSIIRGTRLDVSGDGYLASSNIGLWLNSESTFLGSATTQTDGTFSIGVIVPADFQLGPHTLQIEGRIPSGLTQSTFLGLEILDRDSDPLSLPASGGAIPATWALLLISAGIIARIIRRSRLTL